MKANGIRRVVTSPGATNVTFVGSLQNDDFFELYSCVDERSAAYMAVGLAAETKEPVALSCTGATSSRNYMPALTDAYYRRLPVLAVTSSQRLIHVGQMVAQVTDRSTPPADTVVKSFQIDTVESSNDETQATIQANEAVSRLSLNGGGPVHINLITVYSRDFSVRHLPPARILHRVDRGMDFPALPQGRIAIFVGSHKRFTDAETGAIDAFCSTHDAVVFCDAASNYYGRYRMQLALPLAQENHDSPLMHPDLLIHIGEITGDYTAGRLACKNVWRVSKDGTFRDFFHGLTHLFNMSEREFFCHYAASGTDNHSYLDACRAEYDMTASKIPELPFSNGWIAQHTAHRIPAGSHVQLGILNSLRHWNFFPFADGVTSQVNVGGFGIDGCVSSLVGASLVHPDRLYFGIFGDLAFFYDINVITSASINNNLRIMVVNNGKGTEFRNYNHIAQTFGDDADKYMAAAGHFGNRSRQVLRHVAGNCGFEYITASNKQEYLAAVGRWLSPTVTDRPMLFEVFTDSEDENAALYALCHIRNSKKYILKHKVRTLANCILGEHGVGAIKRFLANR